MKYTRLFVVALVVAVLYMMFKKHEGFQDTKMIKIVRKGKNGHAYIEAPSFISEYPPVWDGQADCFPNYRGEFICYPGKEFRSSNPHA